MRSKFLMIAGLSMLAINSYGGETRLGKSSYLLESQTEHINRVLEEQVSIDSLEGQTERYQDRITQLEGRRDELQRQIESNDLSTRRDQLQAELDSFPHPLAIWERNLTPEQRRRKEEVKRELKRVNSQLESLQERYSESIADVRELRGEAADLRSSIARQKRQLKSRDESNDQLIHEARESGDIEALQRAYAAKLAFDDMGKTEMDAKFLLMDLGRMERELKNDENLVKAIQRRANERLKDTLIGKYVLDMIDEKMADSAQGESQADFCASAVQCVAESESFQQLIPTLRDGLSRQTPESSIDRGTSPETPVVAGSNEGEDPQ